MLENGTVANGTGLLEKATQDATTKNSKGLTTNQVKAVNLMIQKDINGMSYDDIAKACGVDRSTLYRWKQKPAFNDYLLELTEEFQRSFLNETYIELRKILMFSTNDAQKLKAIELMLKNQGRLKEVKETTTTVEAEVNVQDLFKELGI